MKKFLAFLTLCIAPHSFSQTINTVEDLKKQALILRPVWSAMATQTDSFSSNNYDEIKNLTGAEQIYYIPDSYDYLNQNTPLYRLYNGIEHMDSLSQSEGSYSLEGPLGYGWPSGSAPVGTSQIFRTYNPTTGDHGLANVNTPLSNSIKKEYFNISAYPRYPSTTNSMECINGSAIELCSNKRAGGAVWSLKWKGKNFVNVTDYGRQIQASLGQIGPDGGGFSALPTEAGDNANASLNSVYWHGSPLAMIETLNKSQKTRAIPLEWNYSNFGGNLHRPIIYPKWQLGKNVYLDNYSINLGVGFNYLVPQIIVYDTVISLPTQLGNSSWKPSLEMPTGYVDSGESNFNRFFVIDSSKENLNEGLTEINDSNFTDHGANGKHYQSNGAPGGVAISTDNLSYVIGVYNSTSKTKLPDPNGYIYFTLWKFGSVNKWTAAYKGTLYPGESTFRSYILVGTLDEVRTMMRQLYVMGY